jgi:tetrapyrrole methylase family protein/MazG family protein
LSFTSETPDLNINTTWFEWISSIIRGKHAKVNDTLFFTFCQPERFSKRGGDRYNAKNHYEMEIFMPAGITIIGLGSGNSQYWTQAVSTMLSQTTEVFLRTAHHPSVVEISAKTHNFDDWLKQGKDTNQVYEQISAEIVRLGQRDTGVVYAVPGHPTVDEPTVPRIRELAQTHQLPVIIMPGLSLIETARTALNLDGSQHLQIVEATEVARLHHPPLAPDRPALIVHLHQQNLVREVKRTLLNAYPDNFELTLVKPTSDEAKRLQPCALRQLDQQPHLDCQTILYLPPDTNNTSFTTFQETIAHLRAPDGCPWDRAQTHQSLRPFLLEEAYEVLETLDADEPAALAEELGDLLLQIVLHTQIATDTGEFKMGDVISHIHHKLLRRHPHVFGDIVVNGVEDVSTNWEIIKKAEKVAKGQLAQTTSALDGIPPALPALTQALTISKRAVKMGFEWPNIEGVLDQLIEEAQEITEASNPAHLEAEIGDLLFSAVNLARWHNIDPESALRGTNARFRRRFRKMEELAATQGKNLSDMSIEEMETLWNEAKSYEA